MSQPILEMRRVSKSFGALKVADGIDLSVNPGQSLGVIGPNGAGKSTMFNLVAGVLPPDEGHVFFDGADVTGKNMAQRCRDGIGRSYQIPHPFEGMSVFENLLVGARFGGAMPDDEAYAVSMKILTETELLPKANALAGTLSLLERKRLELARALATQPRLLLLDEIAGGLTEAECQSLIATIKGIRDTGVSIIWIEHVTHALLAVVDSLMVLNFGMKIAEGEPREVMESREVREIYMGLDADA
ncbi:MAG: ABC transporter ATP-binding protein [Alphaproteobacteria bacterium]|nr:ABC transporter ATP-binding protein [Alphaproteobacteria bacterium]